MLRLASRSPASDHCSKQLENMFNLKEFVSSCNLEVYETRLREQGYDSPFSIFTLDSGDLEELDIRDEATRQKIIDGVNNLDIRPWLAIFNLERLYERLSAHGISTVWDLKQKTFTEEDMDDMDILRPAFRKRLQTSVNLLRGQYTDKKEAVVAEGYWARTKTLEESISEFLCIDGFLKAKSGVTSEPIFFMVDTGSEVSVTAQMDIITELQLPKVDRIKIKGAHTVKETDAYGAILIIGGHEMEVQVVQDEHNSVGAAVVRHFRHLIDSRSHKWLLPTGTS